MHSTPLSHSDGMVDQPDYNKSKSKQRYSTNQSRSRNGCSPCKKLRKKCGEEKPACSTCEKMGRQCEYAVKLQWGGRSFQKSRFGDCLNTARITIPEAGFIYGYRDSNQVRLDFSRSEADDKDSMAQNETDSKELTYPRIESQGFAFQSEMGLIDRVAPVRNMELPAIEISLPYRFLLDHFIHSTSVFLASHETFYRKMHNQLIPMSFQSPHVFSAVLALACRSCLTQGVSSIKGADLKALISHFTSISCKGLREGLSSTTDNESLIATSLLLCLGEIYAGGHQSRAWSIHLEGAKALMAKDSSPTDETSIDQRKSLPFLNHLFLGIVVQAVLRPDLPCHNWLTTNELSNSEHFLDEYLGFSTELIPILRSIGQAAQLPPESCVFEGEALLRKVNAILSRDDHDSPQLRPNIHPDTPHIEQHQFLLSNTAYMHAAKIHICRRLLGKASTDSDIQSSVQIILDSAQQMIQGEGRHPWITLVMPIFTAGCEAQSYTHRTSAAAHLYKLEKSIGAQNIHHVRNLMEKSWEMQSWSRNSQDLSVWSRVAVQTKWDFITF